MSGGGTGSAACRGSSSCVGVPRHLTGVPGRAVVAACNGEARFFCHGVSFLTCSQKRFSLVCASSNNPRRNPDFSRQQRGSSRGRSRQYQERDSSDSIDESDPVSTKNGPLLALNSNPRSQATATPGQREKEIVELFRKVQAQLRERAAIKEEKKIEATSHGQNERGTVDSLLKLLRKHSVDQRRKSVGTRDHSIEQSDVSADFEDEHNSGLVTPSSNGQDSSEPEAVAFSRPVSSFRRRSPVPRAKFKAVYSVDEEEDMTSSMKPASKAMNAAFEPEPSVSVGKSSSVDGPDIIPDDHSDPSDGEEDFHEEPLNPAAPMRGLQLAALKLTELREVAKSRGIKGYSKLKKSELVELLSSDEA